MSSYSEDNHLLWLKHVLIDKSTDLKISKILNTVIESVVPPGENYCSSIYRVKMRCSLQDGSERNVSVIVKQVFCSDKENVVIDMIPEIFRIEIKVYSFILPLMEKLMAEFNDEREMLWCQLYGHWTNRKIVLEDLSDTGFRTLGRTGWLSMEYSSLVLKNLARFHAMSKILIDRGLIKKSDFTHNSTYTDTEFGQKLYAGPLEVLADTMLESWGPEWQEMSDRIRLQVPLLPEKINKLTIDSDDRYLVFNHGDLWTCNIMLKIGESNSAESLRFLDFQYPCINSFMWDVSTLMFTSIHPKVRRVELHNLLSIYHESLNENLRFFNCESYIPTLNDVLSEFDRVLFLSFTFNMTFFPMWSSANCKPFEIKKILSHSPQEIFDKRAFTDERIVPELKEDLKMYIDKGVI